MAEITSNSKYIFSLEWCLLNKKRAIRDLVQSIEVFFPPICKVLSHKLYKPKLYIMAVIGVFSVKDITIKPKYSAQFNRKDCYEALYTLLHSPNFHPMKILFLFAEGVYPPSNYCLHYGPIISLFQIGQLSMLSILVQSVFSG